MPSQTNDEEPSKAAGPLKLSCTVQIQLVHLLNSVCHSLWRMCVVYHCVFCLSLSVSVFRFDETTTAWWFTNERLNARCTDASVQGRALQAFCAQLAKRNNEANQLSFISFKNQYSHRLFWSRTKTHTKGKHYRTPCPALSRNTARQKPEVNSYPFFETLHGLLRSRKLASDLVAFSLQAFPACVSSR